MPPELIPQDPAPGTPAWWVRRLSLKLDQRLGRSTLLGTRQISIDRWEQYYRGRLNLALQSDKWRTEFADRFPQYTSNFMELVVDKHRERLAVQGIRYGEAPGSDDDAWEWWQTNRMDAESLKLHREALVKGAAYALVWPNDEGVPELSLESPNEVIVETTPGKSWKRIAALKRYLGDDRRMHAELYLPDALYKYRSAQSDSDFSAAEWTKVAAWEPEQPDGEDWPIRIPIKVVPMVQFLNKPDLIPWGWSKINPVASNQDAVNKYRVDAFVASEFASFRQRWAIGVDIPTDPVTGEPVEPFKAAVDRVWLVQPPSDDQASWNEGTRPQFGEFEATPLGPFYDAIQGEVQMLGAISRTPYHYLLPQTGQPPSGDSLRSAEAGLVAEVLDSMTNFGEGYEELFRLNFLWRQDARADQPGAELIWRDPETQSEGEHIDALMKMKALGVPEVALWERMHGVTQQTIKRWKRLQAQDALLASLRTPTPAPTTTPPGEPQPAPGAPVGGNGQVA